jgi:hypothetical protein
MFHFQKSNMGSSGQDAVCLPLLLSSQWWTRPEPQGEGVLVSPTNMPHQAHSSRQSSPNARLEDKSTAVSDICSLVD